ncbi:MAG: M36 family metallopeptidase [Candidatus Polarisedimenticolia bacterium]
MLGEQERKLLKKGAPVHVHEGFGVPTYLWAAPGDPGNGKAAPGAKPADTVGAARGHLARFAALYGLEAEDLPELAPGAVHDTGRGLIIASFQGRAGGLEIFREEIKVAMDRDLEAIALSGYVMGSGAWRHGGARRFALKPNAAVAAALSDLTGREIEDIDLKEAGEMDGGFVAVEQDPWALSLGELVLPEPARVKKLLFRLPDRLEPAYYVEVSAGEKNAPDADHYAYVISAADGEVLFRHDLTVSDAFGYRVWADPVTRIPHDGPQGTVATPHPTGITDQYQAPFASPSLVTLQNGPISTNDPWLPAGATVTTGNNVDAYADILGPDGFGGGDLRATTTSSNTFDRTYDTALAPGSSASQRMAAVTQLFYDVNFLHDWFYDHGFNEASGNAQADNYGRGGFCCDAMRAEGQDFGARNNANMSTPSDGASPRMQMYIFDGIGRRSLTVNSPPAIADIYAVGMALFGPTSFTNTQQVTLVDDGVVGTGTVNDGCTTPFVNAAAVVGRIALVDRGGCNFTVKVKNSQLSGAIGAIVANNVAGDVITMGGADGTITIGSLLVSQDDGNLIKAHLGTGVNVTLFRELALDRDGTIDNQIVAHEWGHYISNRLIGNAAGLNNQQGGGMGEGWGDFTAMLMTVRPEDANHPAGPGFTGVYGLVGYVNAGGGNDGGYNDGYYFGIRRYPYSIDFTKNPLTFHHISNGVPLPAGPPIEGDASGTNNAEVHNTGEVWASMLWECYAALLRDSGRLTYNQAQSRMMDYLVAGYKLTPPSPTFLEARDAVLTAASADAQDHALCYQAFARRGAGLGAVAPDRFSTTLTGVVESYTAGGELTLDSASVNDSGASCDMDGVLDGGESGQLTVTLRNSGMYLSGTTGTVTSPDPDVQFPTGNAVAFPPSFPLGTTTVSLPVRLAAGGPGLESIPFEIAFDDPGLAVPGPVVEAFTLRGHFDEEAMASATDDVESSNSPWAPAGSGGFDPSRGWRRIELAVTNHRWLGPDPDTTSDQWVISPPLQVGAGTFMITFKHQFSFESSGGTNYDGGVMEISNNGGSSWVDIATAGPPGYNGIITVTGGGNPLQGRQGFVGASPGYPSLVTNAVNLGTTFAGQTVRVRFRVGADGGVGAPGWEIDDLQFAGITNLPFPAIDPETEACADTDLDGHLDPFDCAPLNGGTWAPPTETSLLMAANSTTLSWTASTGATAPLYDVLRATSGSGFASAFCLESGGTDLTAEEPGVPGTVWFYLVRSSNACGSITGFSSAGTPITGASCP